MQLTTYTKYLRASKFMFLDQTMMTPCLLKNVLVPFKIIVKALQTAKTEPFEM